MANDVPLRKARANQPLAAVASPSRPRRAPERPATTPDTAATRQGRGVASAMQGAVAARFHFPTRISIEGVLYLLFAVAALFSRFYNLGYEAEHHDESLHSFYSWTYYVGGGYIHDPLMHGPFLFHGAALSYLLFGDSDASSRYFAAAISVATVLLPWFLRRELGKWGALTASGLLLASPSFLYFGRFHRHDVYSAFFTLLLFIAIVRFVAERRPLWIFVGAAAWGFHFTNKEDYFIITAIFGSALVLALFWTAARRILWIGGGMVVALGFVAKVLPKLLGWPKMPPIPWDRPTNEQIKNYIAALSSHPVVLCGIFVLAGFVVILVQQLNAISGKSNWNDALFGDAAPGTPAAAAHAFFSNRRTLYIALTLFVGIYTVLYTAFFSNLIGIFTGSLGAIFYWLGQQDVRRGDQPWFYYLLLVPQYDPIPAFFGGIGLVLTGWRLFAHRAFGRFEGPFPFARGFMAYWAFASIALYTWTGEKMPWIVVHPTLPFLLLAALVIGRLIEYGIAGVAQAQAVAPASRFASLLPRSGWFYGTLMVVALVGGFFATAQLANGDPRLLDYSRWNLLFIPWLAILALVGLLALVRGWHHSGRTTLLALSAAMLFFQIHAGWALAFQNGDVPKDMLVYVQTSPDVTRFMKELDEFSELQTGGKDLPIYFDDSTSWPFNWYLRNYTRKNFFSCSTNGCTLAGAPNEGTAIVLVGNDNLASHPELTSQLSDFVGQPYEMRWNYPEEVYRVFALAPELDPGWNAWSTEQQPYTLTKVIGSVFASTTASFTPQGQANMFRILAYHDLRQPLGTYGFTVFVHKDLLPQFNAIRYR
ncbi:MAG: TIGR03663 family protein [Chloroflexia bacterium]